MLKPTKAAIADTQATGNRRRIIEATLEMCNASGERNVTTNHICAHLGISPGNLYYHFRNKQEIIFEIYQRLEVEMLAILHLPEGRRTEMQDIFNYVNALFQHIWRYRFFFHDVAWMLENSPQLKLRYPQLTDQVLASGRAIYGDLAAVGLMQANQQEIESLTLNSWIVLTYWLTYERIHSGADRSSGHLTQGIRQFVALFYAYLTPQAKAYTDELMSTHWAALDL